MTFDYRLIGHDQTMGPSASRNDGIKHLLTDQDIDAIIPLDADDLLADGWPTKAIAADLENHDIVTGRMVRFGQGIPCSFFSPEGKFSSRRNNSCLASATIIHRRVFESGLWYDESMRRGLEDWHFYNEAILQGFRIDVRPDVILHARIKPDALRHTTLAMRHQDETIAYMRDVYMTKYGVQKVE